MINRLTAFFSSSNRQLNILLQPILADVIRKGLRAQRHLYGLLGRIVLMGTGIYNSLNCHMPIIPFVPANIGRATRVPPLPPICIALPLKRQADALRSWQVLGNAFKRLGCISQSIA